MMSIQAMPQSPPRSPRGTPSAPATPAEGAAITERLPSPLAVPAAALLALRRPGSPRSAAHAVPLRELPSSQRPAYLLSARTQLPLIEPRLLDNGDTINAEEAQEGERTYENRLLRTAIASRDAGNADWQRVEDIATREPFVHAVQVVSKLHNGQFETHVYDAETLTAWFACRGTSPMTREPLDTPIHVVANVAVQNMSRDFQHLPALTSEEVAALRELAAGVPFPWRWRTVIFNAPQSRRMSAARVAVVVTVGGCLFGVLWGYMAGQGAVGPAVGGSLGATAGLAAAFAMLGPTFRARPRGPASRTIQERDPDAVLPPAPETAAAESADAMERGALDVDVSF